jgi:hypothetical protein
MSLLRKIGKFFGIKSEAPLNEKEISLLNKLKTNRELALQLIPSNMKHEFLSYIYSDKNLERTVKEIYRNPILTNDNRDKSGKLLIIGHVSINGFNRRFVVFTRRSFEDIPNIMTKDITF